MNFQGGKMTDEEAKAFELHPNAELIMRMRFWDDEAKMTNVPVSNLPHLKELARLDLRSNLAAHI